MANTPNTTSEALMLNEPQAARFLGISPRKLFSLRKAGKVPFLNLGERCIRYSREALVEWIAEQTANAKKAQGGAQ